jgi:hypothetical protein
MPRYDQSLRNALIGRKSVFEPLHVPWKIRLEDVPDKVVNGKQTIVVGEIEFHNAIAVVIPLLPLHCSVVSVEASILLVVRDGEDKDLPVKTIHLFLRSILIRFLLNSKKGSDSNAAAMHILSIRHVEAFPTILYLAHEKGEKHLHSDLRPVVN